ncbi:MAG: hypothetical protein PHQ47_02665 [Candidatus Portnoybacteria bacterium]|nr:hypothetical protein [Candidatus Portnoybacteria bacterium]
MKTAAKIAVLLAVIAGAVIFLAKPERTHDDASLRQDTNEAIQTIDQRAEQIDSFFQGKKMPLAGFGKKFVEEADRNGIDWRLMPAISVRESGGGKQACGNNPFGWASCRINFKSTEEAIEVVAWNLGGNNPQTSSYYEGNTEQKLWSYNGSVNPCYPGEVLSIMEQIGLK